MHARHHGGLFGGQLAVAADEEITDRKIELVIDIPGLFCLDFEHEGAVANAVMKMLRSADWTRYDAPT